jgi:hypothetical protein
MNLGQGLVVPGPADPLAYLIKIYGAGFMTPPPKRDAHGVRHPCPANWKQLVAAARAAGARVAP